MKLLILGHSYVRDLKTLNIERYMVDQKSVEIEYSTIPGASYDTYLDNPDLLKNNLKNKPDVIVVILGGNSINRDITNYETFKKCRAFYTLLRAEAAHATIISAQVELRFYSTPNRFGCPPPEEFRKKRNELNKFLNRLKLKDFMLIIAGPGRLDNEQYYKDEVHLNKTGLRVYASILKTTVAFALQKIKERK